MHFAYHIHVYICRKSALLPFLYFHSSPAKMFRIPASNNHDKKKGKRTKRARTQTVKWPVIQPAMWQQREARGQASLRWVLGDKDGSLHRLANPDREALPTPLGFQSLQTHMNRTPWWERPKIDTVSEWDDLQQHKDYSWEWLDFLQRLLFQRTTEKMGIIKAKWQACSKLPPCRFFFHYYFPSETDFLRY